MNQMSSFLVLSVSIYCAEFLIRSNSIAAIFRSCCEEHGLCNLDVNETCIIQDSRVKSRPSNDGHRCHFRRERSIARLWTPWAVSSSCHVSPAKEPQSVEPIEVSQPLLSSAALMALSELLEPAEAATEKKFALVLGVAFAMLGRNQA